MVESAFIESIYDDGDSDEDDDGAESSGGRQIRCTVITNALESVATPRQHKGLPKRIVYPLMIIALSWAGFSLVRQREFKRESLAEINK